jgi:hypothetical protein
MPPAAFEPTIPASERPNTHALDRAATGISRRCTHVEKFEQLYYCNTGLALQMVTWARIVWGWTYIVVCKNEIQMFFLGGGNACLQTCYNTTIIVHLLHIEPTFPENKLCIWRHTHFTIICLDFSWYKKHENFALLWIIFRFIFDIVGTSEHELWHSTLL